MARSVLAPRPCRRRGAGIARPSAENSAPTSAMRDPDRLRAWKNWSRRVNSGRQAPDDPTRCRPDILGEWPFSPSSSPEIPCSTPPPHRSLDFDDTLATLVADMYETMAAAPGVGLAAPQVGVPLRLFVYNWIDDDDVQQRGVAINPELWISPPPVGERDEETESEGCLSFPGERFAAAPL